METEKFDVIVIGTGPGGEGASIKAAKEGKKVAVIEKWDRVGGGCTHWGTIPSKSLRQAVQQLVEVKANPLFERTNVQITFPELLKTAENVISKQVKMRQDFYTRNGIDIIKGKARFRDEHTIEVVQPDKTISAVCAADYFVIAAGSRPFRPTDIDFNSPNIFDSDTILNLNRTPSSVTVYGAGVIGCEYASIFRNLGIKVNLINTRDKLLSFLDDEIIDALAYHLREQGILIRHNEIYSKVETVNDGVIMHMESGKQIKTDILLFANGRTGNSEGLGLEKLNIKVNGRSQLDVNENYQTSVGHIYAVGDIVGHPSLASAAYDQGRFASTHIIDGMCEHRLVENIPTGIYTSPEISSIGKTEKELTAEKVPYEVGHSLFKSLARAQITGRTVGMLKILFHRQTLEILGIHCFGSEASEIIHIGQAIMSQKPPANTLMYFINTTFNYPTMAEAYRVAALNGINRVF
ncbi:MAG TPA: Si-specific NAD(P)(+) transhydrogenase [Leptospiraceae bacterium]|nr:Si-specific NAD(P)(+) transhydrogenase [Leptospiraceae bacterium]HMY66416.1 Si-specific NAD(P)(+) transhydrogenase [Leptospiraceae bacterium]HNF25711.1 Si-specific NAD(P)(+) transhydrogenase [Leptospiraceae bacterium]HNH07712.1 Si-specific NAD(P)(+) transhydrogenase [Leptospiraceae bacterium]HNI98899.1 Si-specific NAD(P)(+) transhydrogenase [Leptospiraceae bacterium]